MMEALVYLGIFVFVGVGLSIFLMVRERKRRPKFEVLSDSAGAKAFEDQMRQERMRRVDRG